MRLYIAAGSGSKLTCSHEYTLGRPAFDQRSSELADLVDAYRIARRISLGLEIDYVEAKGIFVDNAGRSRRQLSFQLSSRHCREPP